MKTNLLILPGFLSKGKRYVERSEIFKKLGLEPILP